MRLIVMSILCAFLAVSVVAYGYSKMQKQAVICNQEYALCTSAQCIPDPNDPAQTICFCEVFKGESLGHTSCKNRQPKTDSSGVKYVTSTFSLGDFSSKSALTCNTGPWSNCLDQPCTVDPLDPAKAICICKMVLKGPFQTFGGNCDKSACANGYWSGATIEAGAFNLKAMMEALELTESPQRVCSP